MKWTTENIPDLSGTVIVITGGNSGIGFEAAKVCTARGAQTILACRNEAKAAEAVDAIQAFTANGQVSAMPLDLASLESVREFAGALLDRVERIDILLNNAGIMMNPYRQTADGFESQLGVNHLGHFALTGLLLPALLAAPAARVVNVSSLAHRMGTMNFDNLLFADGKGYTPTKAYARSKLANLLFTFELQRRFEESETNAIAVAAHPGIAQTNLIQYIEKHWYFAFLRPLMKVAVQSGSMGSLPSLRAMTDPQAKGGDYFGPRGLFQQSGYPKKVGSSALSRDVNIAKRLWDVSEALTKVVYPRPLG